MEPEIKIDCQSPWHHLIFVEELAYYDKCSVCWEQAVGPVYKCLECNFIQHKSCPNQTKINWERAMKSHFVAQRHHLMLVEEVENGVEEEVVCWGCEEPQSLPAYRCTLPGCTFLLHKSCTELPLAVLDLQHADHVLTLRQAKPMLAPRHPLREVKCNFCLKTEKPLLYVCYPGNFHLHIKCLSPPDWLPRLSFGAHDCHEHVVLSTSMPDPFTCQACGEEAKCSAYVCVYCRLIMDKSCCDFPHSIQTTLHGPSLIFIPSVRLLNKEQRIFCRLCRKRVNTRYGAYYCIKCGYILHLECARRYEDKDPTTESEFRSCEEHNIYLLDWLTVTKDERVDKLEKLKHFDHPQHELTLSHEGPRYDKKCKACSHFLFFPPYYGCVECDFFLHLRCAKVPRNIRRGLLHEHPLTLTASSQQCRVCLKDRGGYGYRCDKCDEFYLDVKCGLLPESLEHVFHEHILFLVRQSESERSGETCSVCRALGVCYVCTDCEFRLCASCVDYPPAVSYRYHPHHLTVTKTNKDQEENYYLICEEKYSYVNKFYWCEKCDFTVDSSCILEDPSDSDE